MDNELPHLDNSLFKIDIPTGQPKPGVLLVAEPFLREEHFNHAVITLIEFSADQSALGLVLNKPTNYTLGETVTDIKNAQDIPIYCGGPMSCDRLFYIHTLPDVIPDGCPIGNDLYLGGDFEAVKQYIGSGHPTKGHIRFFIGYSGWGAGQLEKEINNHVWAVAPRPANKEILREDGDSFWYRTVRSMGETYHNWLYHPLDPQCN